MSESSSKDRAEPSALEEVGAAIKREGRQVADDARAAAQSMVSDQRDVLADYVAALADAASSGARELKDSGYPRSAATIERTAAEVGDFAERLQAREPGELWDDVEGFAREHPALVFGASFVVAFGVARFLKSSAASREEKQATASRPVSAGGA